jgi:hypothetical protein
MDLISWHAFKKLDCKTSVFGQKMNLYIPLVLNKTHILKVRRLLWDQLDKLPDSHEDEKILDTICGLLNSCVTRAYSKVPPKQNFQTLVSVV